MGRSVLEFGMGLMLTFNACSAVFGLTNKFSRRLEVVAMLVWPHANDYRALIHICQAARSR